MQIGVMERVTIMLAVSLKDLRISGRGIGQTPFRDEEKIWKYGEQRQERRYYALWVVRKE